MSIREEFDDYIQNVHSGLPRLDSPDEGTRRFYLYLHSAFMAGAFAARFSPEDPLPELREYQATLEKELTKRRPDA